MVEVGDLHSAPSIVDIRTAAAEPDCCLPYVVAEQIQRLDDVFVFFGYAALARFG